jgi:hypothetical protein
MDSQRPPGRVFYLGSVPRDRHLGESTPRHRHPGIDSSASTPRHRLLGIDTSASTPRHRHLGIDSSASTPRHRLLDIGSSASTPPASPPRARHLRVDPSGPPPTGFATSPLPRSRQSPHLARRLHPAPAASESPPFGIALSPRPEEPPPPQPIPPAKIVKNSHRRRRMSLPTDTPTRNDCGLHAHQRRSPEPPVVRACLPIARPPLQARQGFTCL